jgi:hypothetical protein
MSIQSILTKKGFTNTPACTAPSNDILLVFIKSTTYMRIRKHDAVHKVHYIAVPSHDALYASVQGRLAGISVTKEPFLCKKTQGSSTQRWLQKLGFRHENKFYQIPK